MAQTAALARPPAPGAGAPGRPARLFPPPRSDEPSFRAEPDSPAPARLLPSGDAYSLLQGRDRELLVPEARLRPTLWTPRVWPGALLVAGEIVGIWRRDRADIAIEPWRSLTPAERATIEAEAVSLPLAGLAGQIRVHWVDERADKERLPGPPRQ